MDSMKVVFLRISLIDLRTDTYLKLDCFKRIFEGFC